MCRPKHFGWEFDLASTICANVFETDMHVLSRKHVLPHVPKMESCNS